MRATLTDSALTRLAGRFVWLELDCDNPANQAFLARHGVPATPTLYVMDPDGEKVTATHLGGMTAPELIRFLEEGERVFQKGKESPPAAALARGDALLGRSRDDAAVDAYRKALDLAKPGSPERIDAVGSLTWALWVSGQAKEAAETAMAEAPGMPRGELFARVVLAGLASANMGGDAPWAPGSRKTLEPLAEEAVGLPTTLRDHRFQLYQHLMMAAQYRKDAAAIGRWGHRWLNEIDAVVPKDDDERSALDIARVDVATDLDEPERVIPSLAASAQAMPTNYNAALRLAQMELAASRYTQALAACDRALAHVTGPMGRTWILKIKAQTLIGEKRTSEARSVLEDALRSAHEIGMKTMRDHNVQAIEQALAQMPAPAG